MTKRRWSTRRDAGFGNWWATAPAQSRRRGALVALALNAIAAVWAIHDFRGFMSGLGGPALLATLPLSVPYFVWQFIRAGRDIRAGS